MAKKAKPPRPADPKWVGVAVGAVFLLTHLIVVREAASPFRLPKEALASAGLAAVAAAAIARDLLGGRLRLPRGPLAAVLGLYPCLLAVSSLWAADARRATATAAMAAVWVVGIVWLGTLDPASRRRIVHWTTAGALISAAVLLLQIGGVQVIELQPETARARMGLTGLAGNPADLTMGIVLLMPLLLPGAARASSWRRWIVPGLMAAVVAVTQTLTGIAALVLLSLTWLALHGSRRTWLVATGAVAVLAAVALAAGIGSRIERELDAIRAGNWNEVLSARGDGWSAAAQMVAEHPATGIGAGGFDHQFMPFRIAFLERHGGAGSRGELATHFTWAHNDPLQVVAELGLVGFAWLLALTVGLHRQRQRGDALPWLGAAALAPFALLHYPAHLAVSLMPIALLTAHVIHSSEATTVNLGGVGRLLAVVALVLATLVVAWQVRRVEEDRWFGRSENALQAAQAVGGAKAHAVYGAVERDARERLQSSPGSAGRLWRVIARARYAQGDPAAAEIAFRQALELWPHEEAEMGLGLALAGQGRRSEAIGHLGRVCRLNPRLAELIPDPDLRRAVRSYLAEIE
jgi:O-antigen ligase